MNHVTEYAPAKTGVANIRVIFPKCVLRKMLKDNKHNSLHLALKLCSDICPWTLSDNVHGQISEHNFAPNGDYCLYIPATYFRGIYSKPRRPHYSTSTAYLGTLKTSVDSCSTWPC